MFSKISNESNQKHSNYFYVNLFLFLFLPFYVYASDERVEVRIVNYQNEATAGQIIRFQANIINKSKENVTYVGHLDLPPGWQAIPANNIFFHLRPFENSLQTLAYKIPDNSSEGNYDFGLFAWKLHNFNDQDRDYSSILIRNPSPCLIVKPEILLTIQDSENDEKESPLNYFEITSPTFVEVNQGEMIFVSALAKTSSEEDFTVEIQTPEGWCALPGGVKDIYLDTDSSELMIYAIKVPESVMAGEYEIVLKRTGIHNAEEKIKILVKPEYKFWATAEGMQKCYLLNEPIEIKIHLHNSSNVPLKVILKGKMDPICDATYPKAAIEVPPCNYKEVIINLIPQLDQDSTKQFVLLQMINEETEEQLYQQSLCLEIGSTATNENDPYIQIPAHVTTMVLGDNGRYVGAIEWAGGGVIDEDRQRFLEFFIRLPTDGRNVIYNVDQKLYVGVSEPEWDIEVGDTLYNLSPLTQNYRYGRGGGFNIDAEDFAYGAHYTQNTFDNDYNPRETCAYLETYPTENLTVSANYLHKVLQEFPTSNIVSLRSELDYKNGNTEIEWAKDFASHSKKLNQQAFYFDTNGRIFNDTWYDIEKVYAGGGYNGYYQHTDSFSSSLDFPIFNAVRGNVFYNSLKQNYPPQLSAKNCPLAPRQHQWNANLSYNFDNGTTLILNSLLLRAHDAGYDHQYDFEQRWAGFTVNKVYNGYSFNALVSFGQQHDYLTGHHTQFLQRYYVFLGKDITSKLFAAITYEGGNTDYYDAKPWRNNFGLSCLYRFKTSSWIDIFLQRVKNTEDYYELNQASIRLNHFFANKHLLQGSVQCFHYQKHYHNDFLFIVAYTIPFNMPYGKRKDIGSIQGDIYDLDTHCPISNAMVNLNGQRAVTNDQGRFYFSGVPTGEHCLKTEVLPKNQITYYDPNTNVNVRGAKQSHVSIPIVPACSISGNIILYAFEESDEMLIDQWNELTPSMKIMGGVPSTRVFIERLQGKEVYSVLTDTKGSFSFTNLHSGEWRVTINTDTFPTLHHLSVNDVVVDIQARENKYLEFKVMPEKRTILPMD